MSLPAGNTPRPLEDALATEPSVQADLWHARLLPLRWLFEGGRTRIHRTASIRLAGVTLDLALGLMLLHKNWRRPALVAQLAKARIVAPLPSGEGRRLRSRPAGRCSRN
jgi:hypothetical protein